MCVLDANGARGSERRANHRNLTIGSWDQQTSSIPPVADIIARKNVRRLSSDPSIPTKIEESRTELRTSFLGHCPRSSADMAMAADGYSGEESGCECDETLWNSCRDGGTPTAPAVPSA
jgi:hypothetical protein